MKSPKISAMVLVGKYDPYLQYCLESIKDIVDEVVIVRALGNSEAVKHFPKDLLIDCVQDTKETNYAAWRNQALDLCSGDWVLMIDADEVLANKNGISVTRDQLNAFIDKANSEKRDSYHIFTFHFLYNYRTLDARDNLNHFSQDRLFRNKNIKYKNKIHETIDWKHNPNSAVMLNPIIWHFGHCKGMEDLRQKYMRSLDIKDNPYRADLKKGETKEQYIARHDLFQCTRPFVNYWGPLPKIMKLW